MKTDIKDLAAILATAIWADGEFDEAEKITLEEIAEAFEINVSELSSSVDMALKEIEPMNEEQVNEYILEHSADIEDEEAEMIFQAVLQIIIVDGVLAVEEVENLLSIASALGIDDARAVLMLVDFVKDEPELEIEF